MNNPTQTNETLMSLAARVERASEAEKEACWRGRGGVRSTGSLLSDLLDEVAAALKARAHSERTGCD